MTVYVQRKGRRRVTKVILHRLDGITILQRQHGVSVPQIVHTAVRRADLPGKLLVCLVDHRHIQMPSVVPREDQAGLTMIETDEGALALTLAGGKLYYADPSSGALREAGVGEAELLRFLQNQGE